MIPVICVLDYVGHIGCLLGQFAPSCTHGVQENDSLNVQNLVHMDIFERSAHGLMVK